MKGSLSSLSRWVGSISTTGGQDREGDAKAHSWQQAPVPPEVLKCPTAVKELKHAVNEQATILADVKRSLEGLSVWVESISGMWTEGEIREKVAQLRRPSSGNG